MLIKEYRIPLPMTVEEYRIAQLYMIQKKSRLESDGRDNGVEILRNEPYTNGPGGNGQHTVKIYHIGRKLPAWLKAIISKTFAPQANEEAWNAYPYTKTRYTTPTVSKFCVDIETVYKPDSGTQNNVFNLTGAELRDRTVELVDVVRDDGTECSDEEDPKLYHSVKTGRGPLGEDWINDYQKKGAPDRPIMCAYKLCRVEFKYWGMQNKIENWICDLMRKTMLHAHRQAWCWQDEYHGLTIADIRKLELETQLALAARMGGSEENIPPNSTLTFGGSTLNVATNSRRSSAVLVVDASRNIPPLQRSRSGSKQSFHSPCASVDHPEQAAMTSSRLSVVSPMHDSWTLESLRTDLEDGSDDEFFDASEAFSEPEEAKAKPLVKWSSMELTEEDDISASARTASEKDDSIFSATFKPEKLRLMLTQPSHIAEELDDVCLTSILILIFHGGSILDNSSTIDLNGNRADISTMVSCFDTVVNAHYPTLHGHVVIKGVRCPPICAEALTVLSSLTPYSFDVVSSTETTQLSQDYNHLSALSIFATSSPAYREIVSKVIKKANQVYHDFIHSAEGRHYKGPVCLVGDSTAGLLVYDALCRYGTHDGSSSSISSERNDNFANVLPSSVEPSTSVTESRPTLRPTMPPASRSLSNPGTVTSNSSTTANNPVTIPTFAPLSESGRYLSAPVVDKLSARRSSDNSDVTVRFDFDVGDVFNFGCPLGLVLAYRKFMENVDDRYSPPARPWCAQLFNLFHPSDPSATRIEPLLSAKFSFLKPAAIPRYQKFPLGDGRSYFLYEHIQQSRQIFATDHPRPTSDSVELAVELSVPPYQNFALGNIGQITRNWWGVKRIDYALYCPEGTASFPASALPHLFHASFWESLDVVAFMIRQIFQSDNAFQNDENSFGLGFASTQPTEKWLRRRTSMKLKNMHPNHRGNDIVIGENLDQILCARFMYGPLDMLTLTGEKVDIYVMTQPPSGEWVLFGTEITSSHGRVVYQIPDERKLGLGMYPIKMIVRGDHTSVDFYLTVVPPRTESVVFSIDGSFTASVSVTGKDPKVRPAAVDIVRHWQELGYLIVYITGRPDMQHQAVVSWLAHHNFPHGMVSFCDGVVADPQRQKANFLKALIEEAEVVIHAAYGSSKDIQIYASVGLKPEDIYCIGKTSKKLQDRATMLNDGYSAHLNALITPGGSRPAQGNARMVIRRGCFSLPQPTSAVELKRHKSISSRSRHTPATATDSPPPSSGTATSSGSTTSPYTPRFSFRTPETSPKDDKDTASLKGSIGGRRRKFFSRF